MILFIFMMMMSLRCPNMIADGTHDDVPAGNFGGQKLVSIGKQSGIIKKAQEAAKEAQKVAKTCNDMKPPK